MVMTVIRVATPMVRPSIVSEARSLCARMALKHCAKLSRMASMGEEEAPPDTLPNLARRNPGIRGWPPSGGHTGANRPHSSQQQCYTHHYRPTLKGSGELSFPILEQ